MYESFFKENIKNARLSDGQIYGLCPFHEDANASFSANVYVGLWKCHGCEAKGNAPQFADRLGIDSPKVVYVYKDELGNPLFRVIRSYPKRFSQERFEAGAWVKGLNGTKRVLYRLPDILGRDKVCIVEGEKDADRLWNMGIPTTCNPGGAGKWRNEFNESLTGKKIIIIPDNDDQGQRHARQVAKSLLTVTDEVKIVMLSDLSEKGDISDWLNEGHTKEELFEHFKNTPLVEAEALQLSESIDDGTKVIPAELHDRLIHPAIYIEPGLASIGFVRFSNGKPGYLVQTSQGGPYEAEKIKDRLITPYLLYPDLAERWVPTDHPLSICESVGMLIGKMQELVSFEDERWYSAAALWAAGTYLFPAFPAFPYFQLTGEKGSGKTKFQDIFGCVCFNAIKVVDPTPAVLFRIVHSLRPTLLIDEAERMSGDEVRAIQTILNAGYKPGNAVPRVIGDSHQLQFFEVYSPKSFASINSLGSVTEDRCITAVMARPPKGDLRQNKNVDSRDPVWSHIRSGFYQLPFSHADKAFCELDSFLLPDWLLARERELWSPIFWLAKKVDEEENLRLSEDITGLAREMQKNKGMDFDAETVIAVLEEKLGDDATTKIRPGELVEELEKRLRRKIDPAWVGQKFRTLGIAQRRRDRQGQIYEITAEQLRDIRARYAS